MTSATAPTLARRPRLLVFDVNETLSDLRPLGDRFVEAGAPAHLVGPWFAGVLRDGFALTVTGAKAIIREVREELDASIRDLTYLDVVESIYTIDDRAGHEIVFVYTGRLDPQPAREGAQLREADGSVLPVVWRSLDDATEPLPLYPAAVGASSGRLSS